MRPFHQDDAQATALLLYQSAGGMYDRYAGSRELALRALDHALRSDGTAASADVVTVAEIGGRVAGAMASMPFAEWTPRANAFLRVTLRSIPPWRWPSALWLYRASGRTTPEPPAASLYVDSLATDSELRRRGVASALLEEAERKARERGLRWVALDTWVDNGPARALYRAAGFEEVASTPPLSGMPGGVSLLRRL